METFIGVLLGGGILAFIEFLIKRHDSKHDRFNEVLKAIDGLKTDIHNIKTENDERYTVQARIRILRFEDELQEGRLHSKDSFDQVMSDISLYNKYCDGHPYFKNDQTVMTVRHIQDVYTERLKKHDWFTPSKGE